MHNERNNDTIAAIATPPGEGGIAIVRISGTRAGDVLRAAFRPAHRGEMKHGQMRYGTLTDRDGAPIDEVMAVFFRAPRSYTREDVAEIHLHGGTMCARAAMERLLSLGARAAEPGEFTYRAFMNGRVDLSEAEAIMGLIGARSQAARRASVRQLRGGVSAPIGRMRGELTGLLAKIEAATDFPDEIDEDVTARDVADGASRICDELSRAADARRARIVRDGASVVLCGSPNVGKSSLMNALLSADRAIVTDIPGTTRDVLTESFEIGGVRYQLSDTAGLRETSDAVEKIGVERARDALRDADCVLLVLDASSPLSEPERAMLADRDERYVTVLNKCDLLLEMQNPEPARQSPGGNPSLSDARPAAPCTASGTPCVSSGTSSASDGTSPVTDAMFPASNSVSPAAGGALCATDAMFPASNGVSPAVGGALCATDAAFPASNGVSPVTDAAFPASNGVSPALDDASSVSNGVSPATDGMPHALRGVSLASGGVSCGADDLQLRDAIHASAKTGAGVDEILRAIERVCSQGSASEEPMTLPRHIECTHNAMQALERAIQSIRDGMPLDFCAADLREALDHLGDITGETMNEQVIDRVFSDFCVGK